MFPRSHSEFICERRYSAESVWVLSPDSVFQLVAELAKVFEEIQKKSELEGARGDTPFSEITDDDIDNLFSL